MGGCNGGCWVCYLWGDLDFRCLGMVALWVGDRVEWGFVMSWESWFLFGLMIRGYEFFMS